MNPLIFVIISQVVFESLPVSSSGHMILVERLLGRFGMTLPALPDFFDHFLHGPTVLLLMIFFRKDWFGLAKGFIEGSFKFIFTGKSKYSFRLLFNLFLKIVAMVFVADVITALFYATKNFFHTRYAFFESGVGLLVGFVITMIVLLSTKFIDTESNDSQMDFRKAILLGVVQGVTLLPGISRFATTYVSALWLGVPVRRAFQFSFLMACPLFFAGFIFNGLRNMFKVPNFLELFDFSVVVTLVVSSLAAYILFYLAYEIALRKKIYWFGYYMLLPIFVLILDLLF